MVAALHAAPTPRTRANLDVEAAHLGEFFLILRGRAGDFDGAPPQVGARPRCRCRMDLIDPRRAAAAPVASVLTHDAPKTRNRKKT